MYEDNQKKFDKRLYNKLYFYDSSGFLRRYADIAMGAASNPDGRNYQRLVKKIGAEKVESLDTVSTIKLREAMSILEENNISYNINEKDFYNVVAPS